jgi:hypothetical protein
MSNPYKGPSKDAPYQVSEETIFFLEINQSETRIACGGYDDCSFISDPLTNMAAMGNSCF